MSLYCLAILGYKNEPLHVCTSVSLEDKNDNSSSSDENNNSSSDANESSEKSHRGKDLFGFFDDDGCGFGHSKKTALESEFSGAASMRYKMMMHASIDRIDELLGSHRKISWKRFQRGSHWIGQICSMEEYDIYGYVTTSDVKILALLERDGIVLVKKRKEVDIKIMFTAIHDCYVEYTMNPFSKIKGHIQTPCTKFKTAVQLAMDQYNNSVKRH